MNIHPTSLFSTLDSAAEKLFYQESFSNSQREEIVALILNRQCQTGVNAGFFLPFTAESEMKFKLFSGELLKTTLVQNHLPMIEAVRILKLLDSQGHASTQAIHLANQRMEKMCYSSFCAKGECKALTIAYLRYISLDGIENSALRINTHLATLAGHRDKKGRWSGFPFFYTLLMLLEITDPLAAEELQYALPACIKLQSQKKPAEPISKRRQEILRKVLVGRVN
jgi:hypothetical protein